MASILRTGFGAQASMGKTLMLLLIMVFLSMRANANDLAVRNIPENLMKDANAVVRNSQRTITVKNLQSATLRDLTIITILNKDGKDLGHFSETYDQNQRIKVVRAEVYDRAGNRVSRLKSSDVADRSYVSNISVFEDTRIKSFEVHHPTYPYTVLIEYEKEYQGFVGLPTWVPQFAYNMSVQEAGLTLVYPEANPVRFRTMNMNNPEMSSDKGNKHYSWHIQNLEARRNEPLSVPAYEYLPLVYISPQDFFFHNTRGNFETWSNYGDWVANLLVGQQNLPDNVVRQIKELIADVPGDKREKAKRIYEYMQNHTRYVSIQLGIGGFQPFPAGTVVKTGYGDCKALSNYTMALLAVAGIDSYYTEIGSGNRKIRFDDFPSPDQTNHAILCVPLDNDTVWLECTSQRYPFGYVPRSNMYRKALLVAKNGSKLVKMPSPDSPDNSMNLIMTINLDESGNAQASLQNTYRGVQIETLFPEVWQSEKEQRESLHSRYGIPGANIQDFTMKLVDEEELYGIETLNMSINSLAAKTGSRLFLNPNPFNPLRSRWSKIPDRKTDFEINYPYHDQKTFTFLLPEGMKPENIPDKVELETPYGLYILSVEATENSIIVRRELAIYLGRYPADQYNDYVDFRQAVYRADRNQIVLVNQ